MLKTSAFELGLHALAGILLLSVGPCLSAESVPCGALAISSPEQPVVGKKPVSSFSATRIVDLNLDLLLPEQARKSGVSLVEYRVFGPSGNLYQSITLPVSFDNVPVGTTAPVPGYPSPLPVQVATPVLLKKTTTYKVMARLPVAGTLIVSSSLYGGWTSTAFLDGKPISCTGDGSFTISK